MFSKITSMLGKAWDTGKSLVKPLTGKLASGWDMLKNGAMKVGKFVGENHEAIGSVLTGVGNIIGNLRDSPLKQKLQEANNAAQTITDGISGGGRFSNLRPSNTQRKVFSNNLNGSNTPKALPQPAPQPAAVPQATAPAAPTGGMVLGRRSII